ncbi:MAG: hypothetical protein OEO77_09260 [Acidimicrobiia bacterium]|nr:hypothetical protein [Acidimicrobiia bacterium]
MPTYVYRCEGCAETLEVLQSFSDKPLRRHGECGGSLNKVFQPAGLIFKGSGFYVTDTRSAAPSDSGSDS